MTGGLWTLPDGDPFDVDAWLSLPPVDVWDNVTLTDAESWLWSTIVMDAAATLLYPHRYPTS